MAKDAPPLIGLKNTIGTICVTNLLLENKFDKYLLISSIMPLLLITITKLIIAIIEGIISLHNFNPSSAPLLNALNASFFFIIAKIKAIINKIGII